MCIQWLWWQNFCKSLLFTRQTNVRGKGMAKKKAKRNHLHSKLVRQKRILQSLPRIYWRCTDDWNKNCCMPYGMCVCHYHYLCINCVFPLCSEGAYTSYCSLISFIYYNNWNSMSLKCSARFTIAYDTHIWRRALCIRISSRLIYIKMCNKQKHIVNWQPILKQKCSLTCRGKNAMNK